MGSKSSGSAPPAPDPQQVASAQYGQNVQTAIANARMNNVNQYTPYGSVEYHETGPWQQIGNSYVPQYKAIVTLSPEQQKLYETQTRLSQGALELGNQALGNVRNATATPFNYDGLPGAPVYDENFRQQQLGKMLQRAEPQQARDHAAFEQRLADQGIGVQDPAFRTAWDQYDRGLNDFRLGADLQSMSEAERAYALAANTRDRAIQERLNLRNQPINEVAALTGLSGGVTNPQFINTPQSGTMQAPDITSAYGNQYAGQMANWQQQQRSQNAGLGGLMSLVGTIGGSALAGPMGGAIGGGLFGLGGRAMGSGSQW